jgi:Flp pilus assembly protein TadD
MTSIQHVFQNSILSSYELGLYEPIARKARHEAAKLAKRDPDFGRAIELWHELASSPEPSIEALEQLAIYYERYEGNYVQLFV